MARTSLLKKRSWSATPRSCGPKIKEDSGHEGRWQQSLQCQRGRSSCFSVLELHGPATGRPWKAAKGGWCAAKGSGVGAGTGKASRAVYCMNMIRRGLSEVLCGEPAQWPLLCQRSAHVCDDMHRRDKQGPNSHKGQRVLERSQAEKRCPLVGPHQWPCGPQQAHVTEAIGAPMGGSSAPCSILPLCSEIPPARTGTDTAPSACSGTRCLSTLRLGAAAAAGGVARKKLLVFGRTEKAGSVTPPQKKPPVCSGRWWSRIGPLWLAGMNWVAPFSMVVSSMARPT